jgi:hypothetical protein
MTTLAQANSRFIHSHTPTPSIRNVAALFALFAVTACFSTRGQAQGVAPNPGTPTVITNSTSATITYADTAVTDTVDDYSTTLLALVNGSQVSSVTLLAPYSDPTVAAAIAAADGILTGDGASFGSPSLFSSTSVLQSSVITPPSESYTCESAEATGSTDATGTPAVTDTVTFGPATITVGDCNQDSFTILAGQQDINVNVNNAFTIPVETVTTDTYLDSQTYEIAGTTEVAPGVTPEPASVELVLSGLGAIACGLRKRVRNTA